MKERPKIVRIEDYRPNPPPPSPRSGPASSRKVRLEEVNETPSIIMMAA